MTDVLDMEIVNELLSLTEDGRPELLLDLIGMFLDEAPRRIEEMQASLHRGALETLAAAAHSLKGSSGNLGLRLLQHDCDVLQGAGEQVEGETLRARMRSVTEHFPAAVTALEALRAQYR